MGHEEVTLGIVLSIRRTALPLSSGPFYAILFWPLSNLRPPSFLHSLPTMTPQEASWHSDCRSGLSSGLQLNVLVRHGWAAEASLLQILLRGS